MTSHVYRLVKPKEIQMKEKEITDKTRVIIRPKYMALCHADQRYYFGQRSEEVLKKKLPMAMIHECCGEVVEDPTGTYKPGQKVVLIPNMPSADDGVIYESYRKGSAFRSSGVDGFMRNYVDMPIDRVVPYTSIREDIAAITEFVSVGVHSSTRFDRAAHSIRSRIGIWGDGSLAYVMACVLKKRFPNSQIVVVGIDESKLSNFDFVDETHLAPSLTSDFQIDHAFECCGGKGSGFAIDDIIRYINPQGTVMLMGVSEEKVPINTRDILEKGLTFIGSSRSGREDFEKSVEIVEDPEVQEHLSLLIYEDEPVKTIDDIHRVMDTDLKTPFKTVFKWELD